MGQTQALDQVAAVGMPVRIRAVVIAQAVMDVFFHTQMGEQGAVLVDDAHAALFRRQSGDVAVRDPDSSPGRCDDANDRLQDEGLARAGGPQQAEELALPDIQIHRSQRKAGQADAETLDPDHDVALGFREKILSSTTNNNRHTRISQTATGWENFSP